MAIFLLSEEEFREKLLKIRDTRFTEGTLCTVDYEAGALAGEFRFTWIELYTTSLSITVDGENDFMDVDLKKMASIYYYHDKETDEDVFSLCGKDDGTVITLHIGVVE